MNDTSNLDGLIEPPADLNAPRAAHVLIEARRRVREGLDAADACGWAVALLPESRAAQRLMLDWYLRSGQPEQALTRTRALLRQRGDDWRIWIRRAEALLDIDRPDEAFEAIDRTLAQRPNHARALLLAAEIAARLGDHASALSMLERADAHHPRRADIAQPLVRALLANRRVADAAAVLDQLPHAEPELRAATLRAQGRLLDARQLLEKAIDVEPDASRREQLMLDLIDVLEAAGDWPALQRMLNRLDLAPSVAERLADAGLSMGAFDRALELFAQAGSPVRREAPSHAAALAARGMDDRAIEALASPRVPDPRLNRNRRVEPWLRAMLGMAVIEQVDARHARRANADPTQAILPTLLPLAVAAFERAIAHDPEHANVHRWETMREMCETARGATQASAGSISAAPPQSLRQAA